MKPKEKCFIIMPITTPQDFLGIYKDDGDHFKHVLECLFLPAIENAGFEPIPPKSTGSEIIHAEIIKHLSNSELVLCDMSILNPNVFFEFGIRTALNKPVALISDDKATIPFDTGIINFHKYRSALNPWEMDKEKDELSKHIKTVYEKGKDYNALWKYFGIAQTGVFKPEEASIGEKVDLLKNEVAALKNLFLNAFKVVNPVPYLTSNAIFPDNAQLAFDDWIGIMNRKREEDASLKKWDKLKEDLIHDWEERMKKKNKTPEKDSAKQ